MAEEDSDAPFLQGKRNEKQSSLASFLLGFVWNGFGLIAALLSGLVFSIYMQQLHETRLWFTSIKQVEQEISLRTEAGFYYSYYKDMVSEDSNLNTTVHQLMHDVRTEFPREINVFERFNVYQELLLAMLYRAVRGSVWLPSSVSTPMLFYVYSCFAFAGFGVTALFLLSWKLSMSWLFGLLVFAWMVVNFEDSVRVFFTVNLRENFSLPFFWLQNLCAVCVIQRDLKEQRTALISYLLTTFVFTLFWQFSQFILLLQSVAIFADALLFRSLTSTAAKLLVAQSAGFLLALIAQFAQPMMLVSVCVSFNIAAVIVLLSTDTTSRRNSLTFIIFKLLSALVMGFGISSFAKHVTGIESDSHIWTFVKAKLGFSLQRPVPFETALYLCHGAFAVIDRGYFERTTKSGCFPMYSLALLVVATVTIYSLLHDQHGIQSSGPPKKSISFSPEILFFMAQSALSGVVTVFTLRMKYLWFPQMATASACFLSMSSKLFGRFFAKSLAVAVTVGLLYQHYGVYLEQMANEQEFYDPDTVELMEWISSSTERNSSFSGSMQLMAGVKACTGRMLANHPHFEDKWLRRRTVRLYQIYGRKSVPEVNEILRKEKVDFIILEDSICLARSTGCSTNDLVDIENGILPDSERQIYHGGSLERVEEPRFCERIRRRDELTAKYFALVFANHTFRVYRVLENK